MGVGRAEPPGRQALTLAARLRQTCGQLIVGGYVGEEPTSSFLASLRRGHRAGAILFRRNLPSWEAGHAASARLQEEAGPNAGLIAVDQEGGRVQRFGPPVLRVPPMRVLAREAHLVREVAETLGRQLLAIGLNVDFAPVLDVDTNPDNPVIGDRSFSRDAAEVAKLGVAWLCGLQDAGVAACGKHFPGHGDTSLDSHLALPSVDGTPERLRALEIVPFRAAVEAGVDAIMTAHIVVRAVNPEHPATLCRELVRGWLREDLGFRGVVFSDDLEMGAIAGRYEVPGAAVEAVRAGCDIVLICKSERWQDQAHEALVHEAERDARFRERCERAAERSRDLQRRRPVRRVSGSADLVALFADARELQERLQALQSSASSTS